MPPLKQVIAAGGGGATPATYSWSKNLVTDQTFTDIFGLLDMTTAWAFDAVEGLGNGAVADSAVAVLPTVAPNSTLKDQKIIVELKAPNATLECGVILRMTGFSSPDANYYWARITGGRARITKTLAGVSTTIAGGANPADLFPHNAGEVIKITFQVVGGDLTADFENLTTPDTHNLTVTDTDIAGPGQVGMRTGFTNSQIWWRSVSIQSL